MKQDAQSAWRSLCPTTLAYLCQIVNTCSILNVSALGSSKALAVLVVETHCCRLSCAYLIPSFWCDPWSLQEEKFWLQLAHPVGRLARVQAAFGKFCMKCRSAASKLATFLGSVWRRKSWCFFSLRVPHDEACLSGDVSMN
jgi:hypothetical protein